MHRIQVAGLLMACTAALGGCSREPASTAGPAPASAPSVAALLHDADLYTKTIGACRLAPQQRDSAACVNASEAGLKRGLLPCFSKGLVDHACLEAHGYRRN